MDPVSSSSSSSSTTLRPNRSRPQFKPPQPVIERITRALRHPLFLLHRSDSNFVVLGATRNVYTVKLSSTPTCTCPDRTIPCKHILFVLIRALGVSIDDTCLLRRTLRPCRLSRILETSTSPEALARAGLRERFHQIFSERKKHGETGDVKEIEEGTVCPVCLEKTKSRGRRSANCVLYRARWSSDQEKYLNLTNYIGREEAEGSGANGGSDLCDG
ncbi:carotenoid cleavage dioxygenase 8 [Hibiscus syriacus]|uniref:Carotenoid cleavage dioxygenase 8 n=1 Tax=Hibiscus syriacus TaxID=106335 RepID=A0A6A2ZD52_HIBSY|nr:carotenoid cleavage dioxygenase 8 [Hibiscus syriacus]